MTDVCTLPTASQQLLAADIDNAKEGMYARVADEMANGTSLRGYVDISIESYTAELAALKASLGIE